LLIFNRPKTSFNDNHFAVLPKLPEPDVNEFDGCDFQTRPPLLPNPTQNPVANASGR